MPDEKNSLRRAFHDACRHGLAHGFSRSEQRRSRPPVPDKAAESSSPTKAEAFRLLSGDTVVEIGVFDYLTGVVAAEMPVSFEQEALKAQSVAARSYLQRALASPKHEGADICADSACCQAYLTPRQLKVELGGTSTRSTSVKDKRCGQGDRRRVPQL